jgi:hypothetical protein
LEFEDETNPDYLGFTAVHAIVEPGGKGEQERIVEAANLVALPLLTTVVGEVRVEYRGVSSARVIEAYRGPLREWFMYSGDPRYFAGWLTIDGKEDRTKRPPAEKPLPQGYTRTDLVALLRDRERLEASLPQEAGLILGEHRQGRRGFVAVEATIPPDWSQDKKWSVYAEVVDKLFREGHGVEYVYLVLRQGQEIEFMCFRWDNWGLRQYLIQSTGENLDPITIPLMAQWYDHYTAVTP